MAELKALPTFDREVKESVVNILEEVLASAKNGDFDEVMVVVFRDRGNDNYYISKGVDPIRKVGALEMLKQRVLSDD